MMYMAHCPAAGVYLVGTPTLTLFDPKSLSRGTLLGMDFPRHLKFAGTCKPLRPIQLEVNPLLEMG
jgi:hypothetical protein